MTNALRSVLIGLAFAAWLCVSPAALAAGGGKKEGGPSNRIQAGFTLSSEAEGEEDAPESMGESPRAVDIPTIALPAFEDDVLRNYLFVSVRLVVADGVDTWKIRAKTHYLRDAMIRAGHRYSVADPNDPRAIDEERAREVLLEGVRDLMDVEKIDRVEFMFVDSRDPV